MSGTLEPKSTCPEDGGHPCSVWPTLPHPLKPKIKLPHAHVLRRGFAADAGQVVGGVAPGGGVEAAIQGDGVALAAQHALHFHDLVGDGQCGAPVVGRGGVIGLVLLFACCGRWGLAVIRALCLPESLDPLAGCGQVWQGFLGAVDPVLAALARCVQGGLQFLVGAGHPGGEVLFGLVGQYLGG